MNKELYRVNRKAGLRGQGPYPNPVAAYTPADNVKQGQVNSRKYLRALKGCSPNRDTLQMLEQGEL